MKLIRQCKTCEFNFDGICAGEGDTYKYGEKITRPLETFSSGELKKVDIARTLSEENDILFFDEPLNFMDVFFREQLEKAILEYEPTIVFVEHDSRFGSNVSNRVIEVRNNGEVIMKSTL